MSHSMSYWFWCELLVSCSSHMRKRGEKKQNISWWHTKSLKSFIDGLPPSGCSVTVEKLQSFELACFDRSRGECAHAADFVWEWSVWNNVRGNQEAVPTNTVKGFIPVLLNSFPHLVSYHFTSPTDNFIFHSRLLYRLRCPHGPRQGWDDSPCRQWCSKQMISKLC